ncbi:M57 family metalloprotease [Aquimarina sp. RZ0]|uniref:M57 family metalloprotease n=1 Tax=Aquimarina sp. RZ0 TaxID=2607730 RepID=UPI0011F37A0D|nr:M57 family metalloprotease [Aquimarina sp. RZ0]KAA1243513.1 hypothetical protein F0000_20730 [Aquimarina sp. RZ0]
MKHLKILTVFAAALLMVQCQDDNDSIEDTQPIQAAIPEEIIKGLNTMGFNTIDYPVIKDEDKDSYIVEGDMRIATETIMEASSDDQGIMKQRRHNVLVRCSRVRDVKVFISRSDGQTLAIAPQIRAAMNDWNQVNGSFARFREVNSLSDSDIQIAFTDNDNEPGIADLPRNGEAGPAIQINGPLFDGVPRRNERLRFVIRHELGHAIGFQHTNTNEGLQIPGTPNRDSGSTMNRQAFPVSNFQFNNLTNADKDALRRLYGGSAADNICF